MIETRILQQLNTHIRRSSPVRQFSEWNRRQKVASITKTERLNEKFQILSKIAVAKKHEMSVINFSRRPDEFR